eukprot:1609650-Amphidinium_carterae.2
MTRKPLFYPQLGPLFPACLQEVSSEFAVPQLRSQKQSSESCKRKPRAKDREAARLLAELMN